MPLYLPKELHDWYLKKRLDESKSMYEIFRDVLFEYALSHGFKHEHRWKKSSVKTTFKGKLQTYDTWMEIQKCVVCGDQRRDQIG